jgi:serine/threonine protein kinase
MNGGVSSPAYADPLIGRAIGSYQVARKLGEGGMGAVYELVHPTIGKRLALKVLHPEFAARPDIVQRFFDEARAVNLIRHPNIVDVLDFAVLDDGRPYLTMEFLDGEALADHLRRRGVLPPADAVAIARQVAAALAAAHRAGVVHRDLKPDNVFLVAAEGGGATVKVLDFGIAKLVGEERAPGERTQSGAVMGTPAYMAPEQAMGRIGEIDRRSDVYALGVMLFEMLSGALPFRADSLAALIAQHVTETPTSLAVLRPDLPAALTMVIDRTLAKAREDRPASMEALIAALDAAERAVAAPRASVGRRLLPIAVAVVLAATTATILVILRKGHLRRTAAPPLSQLSPAPLSAPAPAPDPDPDPAPAPDPLPEPDPVPVPVPVPVPDPSSSSPASSSSSPAPRPRSSGHLKVLASPWAEVTVDGEPRGPTPVTLELPAGKHRVVLRNSESGRVVRRTVTIRPGRTAEINEALD